MERIRGKLHSRTGASMLIALLFFLVAMTVGAVVLTAASANAGRVKRNRQEQQNYLAVASAAGLLREDITAGTVQPKPMIMGMKLRPFRPRRRRGLSIRNAARAM